MFQMPEQDENQSISANCSPGCKTPAAHKGTETRERTTRSSRKVQAACFTPNHSLKRSPLKHKPGSLYDNGASPLLRRSSKSARSPEKQKKCVNMPPNQVQQQVAPLKRTPPRKSSPRKLSDLADDLPPPTRWELPRTPPQHKTTTSDTNTTNSEKQAAIGTPKDENHLSTKTREGPERESLASTQMEAECLEPFAERDSTVVSSMPHQPSSSSSICKDPIEGIQQLQGLVYTENDLAFLQRRRNIKQYEQLQSQIDQLDKAIKAAAEQKEQLDHKALKINQDLTDMRSKYHQTVSTIHTLIGDPATDGKAAATPQLTLSHVAQLKRVHHLTATQLEKADTKLRRKLSEIIREREEMEMRLRIQEAKMEEENQELGSQAMKEQTQWEMKIQQATREHAAIEERLHDVGSKLTRLKRDSNHSLEGKEVSLREKQRAEERLRRVIRRCELYVQRHQMLKEMNTRGRKRKI